MRTLEVWGKKHVLCLKQSRKELADAILFKVTDKNLRARPTRENGLWPMINYAFNGTLQTICEIRPITKTLFHERITKEQFFLVNFSLWLPKEYFIEHLKEYFIIWPDTGPNWLDYKGKLKFFSLWWQHCFGAPHPYGE